MKLSKVKVIFSFFLLVSLVVPAVSSASKYNPHLPRIFKDFIESFGENGFIDYEDSPSVIPAKRLIRFQNSAAVAIFETYADQRLLKGIDAGLASMLISSYEALERFYDSEYFKEIKTPDSVFLDYGNIFEGIKNTREAIKEGRANIFNAILEYEGVYLLVPKLEWNAQLNNYKIYIVKGHQNPDGSPLNDDIFEASLAGYLLNKYKKALTNLRKKILSPTAEIVLNPTEKYFRTIKIDTGNHLPDVVERLENFNRTMKKFSGHPDIYSRDGEYRSSIVSMSKAKDLILYNLYNQMHLSLIPRPPSDTQIRRLTQIGISNIFDMAEVVPGSERFNEVARMARITPERLLYFIGRSRAYSTAPIQAMTIKERAFFFQRGIHHIGDLLAHDPKTFPKEGIRHSSTFDFPSIDKIERSVSRKRITRKDYVEIKASKLEKLINEYVEEFRYTDDADKEKGKQRVLHLIDLARKHRQRAYYKLSDYELPNFKHKWFVDIEDFPPHKTYLIGIAEKEGNKNTKYEYLLAKSENELSKPWAKFIAKFQRAMNKGERPALIIYSHHEITLFLKYLEANYRELKVRKPAFTPEEMAQKNYIEFELYNGTKMGALVNNIPTINGRKVSLETIATILESFYDMLPIFRKHLAGPSHTNSLKFQLKYLESIGKSPYMWSDMEAGGLSSVAWIKEFYKTGDPRILVRDLQYNAIDCLAMESLWKAAEEYQSVPVNEGFTKGAPSVDEIEELRSTLWKEIGKEVSDYRNIERVMYVSGFLSQLIDVSKLSPRELNALAMIFDLSDMSAEKEMIDQSLSNEERNMEEFAIRTEAFERRRARLISFLNKRNIQLTPENYKAFVAILQLRYGFKPKDIIVFAYYQHLLNGVSHEEIAKKILPSNLQMVKKSTIERLEKAVEADKTIETIYRNYAKKVEKFSSYEAYVKWLDKELQKLIEQNKYKRGKSQIRNKAIRFLKDMNKEGMAFMLRKRNAWLAEYYLAELNNLPALIVTLNLGASRSNSKAIFFEQVNKLRLDYIIQNVDTPSNNLVCRKIIGGML